MTLLWWVNGNATHVTPIDDWREHEECPHCWCRPDEDPAYPGLFIHRALDQRELYETGERRPS